MEQIIKDLVSKTEFTYEELLKDDRRARLVIVRHLLFLHLRTLGYTYKEIGDVMNKTHGTIITCSKSMKGHLEVKDALVLIYVDKLGLKINELLKG